MTGFTAPKILWLRNHEPRHFDKTSKVLLPKDEIRRRLTGEFCHRSERRQRHAALGRRPADLVEADCFRPWNSTSACWPACYESEEVTGRLTPAAAADAGPFDRLPGRRRGRRLRGRGRRQRHRRQGRALHLARHLRRGLRA